MARRTWAEIRTEHIARAGRTGDSAYTARAGQLIEAAHFDICHLYVHHALFTEHTGITLTQGQPWVTLPAGVNIVVGFELRHASTNAFLRSLKGPLESNAVFTQRTEASEAIPGKFARGGAKLYFDTLPDAAYKSTLFYYALATAPNFSSGSPEIGQVWDERIIEWSVNRAQNALWMPNLAIPGEQLLASFLAQMPEPIHSQKPIPERKTAIGGATG